MITNFMTNCIMSFGKALIGGLMIFTLAVFSAWTINKIEDMIFEYKSRKVQPENDQ